MLDWLQKRSKNAEQRNSELSWIWEVGRENYSNKLLDNVSYKVSNNWDKIIFALDGEDSRSGRLTPWQLTEDWFISWLSDQSFKEVSGQMVTILEMILSSLINDLSKLQSNHQLWKKQLIVNPEETWKSLAPKRLQTGRERERGWLKDWFEL